MKTVWKCTGWAGTLLCMLLSIHLDVVAVGLHPTPAMEQGHLLFLSSLASALLCLTGIFRERWFLLPGVLSFGMAAGFFFGALLT
jgi:hypothetical protein